MAQPYKDWINVPDKSRFELSLTTKKGACNGLADITDDEGNTLQWVDATIHPGPASLLLSSPHFYTVVLTIALTAKPTNEIQVDGVVIRPDGTTHGARYQDSILGNNGTTEVILFTLETA